MDSISSESAQSCHGRTHTRIVSGPCQVVLSLALSREVRVRDRTRVRGRSASCGWDRGTDAPTHTQYLVQARDRGRSRRKITVGLAASTAHHSQPDNRAAVLDGNDDPRHHDGVEHDQVPHGHGAKEEAYVG